jgi:uncharacterized protein
MVYYLKTILTQFSNSKQFKIDIKSDFGKLIFIMSDPIIVETIQPESTSKSNINPDDKNIWLLMIIGGIFFGFIPSLVVYLLKSDNEFLKSVAKDNLNFQLSLVIYAFVAGFSIFLLIGFLLLPIVIISSLVIQVLAALAASNGEKYNYPLTIKILS